MTNTNKFTVMQILPALEFGGVERGTLEIAREVIRRGHRSFVVSAGGRMVSQLIDEGSEHLQLPVGIKSPFSLRFVPKLKNLFVDNNVDLVHARSRFPAWLCYLALQGCKPSSRPRFITTVHGIYSINRYSSIMTKGEKVITISEFVKKYILENYPGTDPDKIHIIPRGVDPRYYRYGFRPTDSWLQSWNEQFPETKDKRIVALPGRITRRKGHEDFLEIFKLIKSDSRLHGLIIGGADKSKKNYLHRLKSMIKEFGLEDQITLSGHRNDLREIYCRSDVVLSLAKDPEAFGRTSLEALSLGVPVIAYDHGGAGEVLGNLFPGGLVPAGDIIKTADLILGFINNPPPVKPQQTYTLQSMQHATLSLYESLVQAKSPLKTVC